MGSCSNYFLIRTCTQYPFQKLKKVLNQIINMFVEKHMGDQVSLRQPGHAISIVKSLAKSRKDGLLCDVVLKIENKRYHAHKMVLASCSEYFRVMFTGSLSESVQEEISIETITTEVFDQLIDYFYDGTFVLDMMTVTDMLHASSLLLLKDIENQCISYLSENLNLKNCIQIKSIAEGFANKELTSRSDEYIKKNFEKLSKDKDLCNLKFEDLKTLLLSNDLICRTEDTVAIVIEKWLQARLYQDSDNVRALLKTLRVPFLSKDGFQQILNAMKELDKKLDGKDEYTKILTSESKLQLRSAKKTNLQTCRTSQKAENVLFYLSRAGDTYYYNINLKKSYRLENYPCVLAPGEIAVHNNILYVCGGGYSNCSNRLDCFDPLLNKWRVLPSMQKTRLKHCVTFFENKLYVIGGTNQKNESLIQMAVECYDPLTQIWTHKPSPLICRINSAVAASEKFIYVIGGESNDGGIHGLRSVEKYCPLTEMWSYLPELNHPRIGSSAVYINDKVYVFGGNSGLSVLQNFEYLESPEKEWSNIVIPYTSPISVALALDDKVIAMGASNWGDEVCVQFSFVRRRSVTWEVLHNFIHSGHRVKSFRYGVLQMINYDMRNKQEVNCDCDYVNSDSDDDILDGFNSSSDDDAWFDHDPFGIWI